MKLIPLYLSGFILAGVVSGGPAPHHHPDHHGQAEGYPSRSATEGTRAAMCSLVSASGHQTGGEVYFTQNVAGGAVEVSGVLHGLAPGAHGFHIHQNGDVGDNCKAAGPHFNPHQVHHGAPEDEVRHVGDLGNIIADSEGIAYIKGHDSVISIINGSQENIVGRAVVVHLKEDNLGRPRDEESLKTGSAGARVACCVIQEV